MERTKAEGNIGSIVEYGNLIKEIFDIAKEGNSILSNVEFYQEYPHGTDPKDLRFPLITFRVHSKKLSAMPGSGSGGLKRSPAEIKPRHREEYQDPQNLGYVITKSGQQLDCVVYFDVWCANNKHTDIIAEAFEAFMHTYAGIFLEKGIIRTVYLGLDSEDITNWKDPVAHKIIKYLVILEAIYMSSSKAIEDIRLKVSNKSITGTVVP